MAKQVVIKKQKVKVKKIVYPVVAACFLLALVLTISLSPNMLGLMGNSVINSYICPNDYNLNGTCITKKHKKTNTVKYYKQVLEAKIVVGNIVISLDTEWIENEDMKKTG